MRQIRARLRVLGKSERWLAREVGTTSSNLSALFKEDGATTSYFEKLFVAVGLPVPSETASGELTDADLLADLKALSPDLYPEVRRILESLREGRLGHVNADAEIIKHLRDLVPRLRK